MIFDTIVNGEKICYPCTAGGTNTFQAVGGDPEAVVKELGYFLGRSVCVGAGLFFAGVRGQRMIMGALAGGLAVELFAVGYAKYREKEKVK